LGTSKTGVLDVPLLKKAVNEEVLAMFAISYPVGGILPFFASCAAEGKRGS
jgi:hypothetical protein